MAWLVEEYEFTPTDAYCLVSTCPDFRINVYQMCNIAQLSYVAGAEIPGSICHKKRAGCPAALSYLIKPVYALAAA